MAGCETLGEEEEQKYCYPVPLSPPFTDESKHLEVERAHHASSKSAIYSPSSSDILFHDNSLILLNKPSGIYSDAVLSSLSILISNHSLPLLPPTGEADSCVAGTGNMNKHELHLANRLDRDTSGVMVITKSHSVAAKLVRAFTLHQVKKTYIARCTGSAPKWEGITLRSGHGRSKYGAWRVYGESDIGRRLPGGCVVKEMETYLMVVAVNGVKTTTTTTTTAAEEGRGVDEGFNVVHVEEKAGEMGTECSRNLDEILVRATPKSGRTHQIRLHCRYLGIPIVGDVKYGGVCEWEGSGCTGHQLHAERLVFKHPVTGVVLDVSAPLPSWAHNFRDHFCFLNEGNK